MKTRNLIMAIIAFMAISVSSCDLEDLFKQPTITVTGVSLRELPGEYADIDVTFLLTNNDRRDAKITNVDYDVNIEGFTAEGQSFVLDKTLKTNEPLELTLPLRLLTTDAIQLLKMLDAGNDLSYAVTGIFNVDKAFVGAVDFPINVKGTTSVDIGFENFFNQPEINVNDISGTYAINGISSYTFDLDVNADIINQDNRNVVIDEVEYVVYVEGVKSNKHYYSSTYSQDLSISGGGKVTLDLPVTLNLSLTEGAGLASGLLDGMADYIVEGTFHAIEVDGVTTDFYLPLYVTGSCPASIIQ